MRYKRLGIYTSALVFEIDSLDLYQRTYKFYKKETPNTRPTVEEEGGTIFLHMAPCVCTQENNMFQISYSKITLALPNYVPSENLHEKSN